MTTEPNFSDAERCINLRVKSKQGDYLDPDDTAFVEKMWRNFPVWYSSTEKRIFDESAPFGA
jgi:hypothetical protein